VSSTALVKYQPRATHWARVTYIYANGHRFIRQAGLRCACGMTYAGLLVDLRPCTARPC
jgi:hypothetical protein